MDSYHNKRAICRNISKYLLFAKATLQGHANVLSCLNIPLHIVHIGASALNNREAKILTDLVKRYVCLQYTSMKQQHGSCHFFVFMLRMSALHIIHYNVH